MRVAAVQFKARKNFEQGLEALCRLVREAGRQADLVVCPEMALRGYAFTSLAEVLPVAEAADGPTASALGACAKASQCWVVVGLPERDGERVYNAALVIDPTGAVVWVYRKMLLFEADLAWATPGDRGYRAFDTGVGRFGVGICADINQDRFLAWCAEEDLDAIAFPTNWVQEEGDVWHYWRVRLWTGWPEGFPGVERLPGRERVRAVLVAANSYGREGAYDIRGLTAVLGHSEILAVAGPTGDAVVLASLVSTHGISGL